MVQRDVVTLPVEMVSLEIASYVSLFLPMDLNLRRKVSTGDLLVEQMLGFIKHNIKTNH